MNDAHDTGDDTSRLERVFTAALDRSPSQRSAFVEAACADDPALASRVLALLAAHEQETGPLDVPLPRLVAPLFEEDERAAGAAETAPGARIGPYRIVRLIGRGGMGSVYLGERADGAYEQQVALKVVNAGVITEELERRFLRERQILARLDHPGIARLLHGGLAPDGHPYLAMEFVEGQPITAWAAGEHLDTRARLTAFLDVCDAVHYAHTRLVVHRDLKPSNIFVTPEGRVRLLDFGIARMLADGGEDELRTRTGFLLLTPEYAAPELLRGDAVTTSTDVYALGVVLYEMLTGQRPVTGDASSLAELIRLAETEPIPASRAPGLSAAHRRRLEGDLDAVLGMALRREPERRYATAEALADDVRAHLERRPVMARPDTRLYRARRFVRRHAMGVAASLALAATMLAGLVGTTRMAAAARTEAARSEAVRTFLFDLWEAADPDRHGGDVPTALDLLDRGARRADSLGAAAGPEIRVDMFATLGWLYGKLGEYERAVGMFERAVAEARASFGTDERTGGALDGLAQNLLAAGRAEEAETAIRESLRMRMAAGSPDTLVAGSYATLGGVLSARGRYEEAREAHLASLARESRREVMATDLNNLGTVARHLGDHDEAERYLRESVAIRRERPEHRSGLATSLGNLGSLRRERGDLVEAERLQREALAIRETVFGPDHPDVAISLEQIGLTLRLAGRDHEADSLLSRAVELRRRVLGEDHPETMASLSNLATVRFQRGDYLWAAAVQERVVAAARISDPTLTSRGAITMLHNLGVMRLRAGDLPVAERHLAEALAGRRRLFDDPHADVASSLRWLSELRRMQARFAEAESLGRQALETFEVLLPPGHARIAEAQVCVGSALVAAGRPSEAAPLLRAALEAREAAFPPGSLVVAEAQAWLGTALTRTGDAAEARRLLQAAVSAYEAAGRTDERDAIRARGELDRL